MAETALSIEGLSKRYRLGQFGAKTLHEDLNRKLAIRRGKPDPLQPVGASNSGRTDMRGYFWALRDIDLIIETGDVVGIIGDNGSGKSTLLKILSRITSPTTGRVRGRGRVASLLEVGTGFHPELTGRENIYLNGAIMGMRKHEINARVDEIIDFSGCSRHIDSPVKRYSSGMKVRLGFSVAAHLDCEIMIVDEVLAVGDRSFQLEAIDKMKTVSAESGRTILFVSHNLRSVQDFCTSGVVLKDGRARRFTRVDEAIHDYVSVSGELVLAAAYEADDAKPSITSVSIDASALAESILSVDIGFESPTKFSPSPGLVVYGEDLSPVLGSNSRMHEPATVLEGARAGTLNCRIEHPPIHDGRYFISVWLGDGQVDHDEKPYALRFEYSPPVAYPKRPHVSHIGPVSVRGAWASTAGGNDGWR